MPVDHHACFIHEGLHLSDLTKGQKYTHLVRAHSYGLCVS